MANMAVGNDQTVTDNMVRLWLRDNDPSANLLLDDLEFSADEIHLARFMTVSYWNATPPPTRSVSASNFPSPYHLLMGISGRLLMSAANRFRRNALEMNAGGVAVNDQNKAEQYDEAGKRMWGEYADWVTKQKVATNMSMGWGTI